MEKNDFLLRLFFLRCLTKDDNFKTGFTLDFLALETLFVSIKIGGK